jgi:hypothetical protein
MRVIVESTNGPSCGRRVVVSDGQTATFGRTDAADHAFGRDITMSSRHFQIAVAAGGCFVTDLGSTNGTSVGGVRIAPQQPSPLRDGDSFAAGESQFRVRMEAETSDRGGIASAPPDANYALPPREEAPAPSPTVVRPAPPQHEVVAVAAGVPRPASGYPGGLEKNRLKPELQRRLHDVHFTAETCHSGLVVCRGAVAALSAADLAARLAATLPVAVLVDFQRLGKPPPAELAAPYYVLDWLDPVTAAAVSPVVMGTAELPGWAEIVQQGWGRNAVACLFSKRPSHELLQHVRRCCRKEGDNAVVGYCWPKLLDAILANSHDLAAPFMEGLDAVLLEAAASPDAWQLYGRAEAAALLENLGLKRQTPQTAGAT